MPTFDELEKSTKEAGMKQSSGFLKLKDPGTLVLRVISPYEIVRKKGYSGGKRWVTYVGDDKGVTYPPTDNEIFEFLMYVFDKEDNRIKLFSANWTIAKGIRSLSEDPDYAFGKNGLPGYDIKITKKLEGPASKPSSHKYYVLPGKDDTELPQEVRDELNEKQPIEAVVEGMKNKEMEKIKMGEYSDIGIEFAGVSEIPVPEEAPAEDNSEDADLLGLAEEL